MVYCACTYGYTGIYILLESDIFFDRRPETKNVKNKSKIIKRIYKINRSVVVHKMFFDSLAS